MPEPTDNGVLDELEEVPNDTEVSTDSAPKTGNLYIETSPYLILVVGTCILWPTPNLDCRSRLFESRLALIGGLATI